MVVVDIVMQAVHPTNHADKSLQLEEIHGIPGMDHLLMDERIDCDEVTILVVEEVHDFMGMDQRVLQHKVF